VELGFRPFGWGVGVRGLVTVGIAVLAAGCGEVNPDLTNPDWAKLAAQDIRAAHEMILASHPGPVDLEAPGFKAKAEETLAKALGLAARAETAGGYVFATRAYASGYGDPHVGFRTTPGLDALREKSGDAQWAGLFIGWRDGVASVTFAEPGAGADKGEELVSCDGRSFQTMMREDVFPFAQLPVEMPATWTINANAVLRASGNPFIARPKVCVFRGADGEHSAELRWRSLTMERYRELLPAAAFGQAPKPGVAEIEPGVWWASLPTFDPQDPATTGALTQVIETIRNERERMLASRAVVFDMRGNSGGQSSWGNEAVNALYGPEYAAHAFKQNVRMFWRAEAGNAQSVRESIARQGQSRDAGPLGLLARRMDEAVKKGEPLVAGASPPNPDPPQAPMRNPAKAQVFLLTDGVCMSSCLIFADTLLAFDGVRHIGYPTGADSDYTSIRMRPLPSGHAQLIHPIMIWRHARRSSGTFYTPEITFNAFGWSDESVQAWFLSEVLGRSGR
jgi:hypothetical protein